MEQPWNNIGNYMLYDLVSNQYNLLRIVQISWCIFRPTTSYVGKMSHLTGLSLKASLERTPGWSQGFNRDGAVGPCFLG